MKKKTLWWIIGSGAVLLVLLIIISKTSGDKNTKVAVEKAANHTITETVTASGKIYPETEVKISPEVSGEITDLFVQEGDSVQKGQLLVKINPAIYASMVSQAQASMQQSRASATNTQQMMAQAESQYDLALSTYNRNKKLFDDKVISQLEFEQAVASFKSAKATFEGSRATTSGGTFGIDVAEANLSQARENLRKTTIQAPRAGIISLLNVKKGESVVGTAQMAGTEMLTIADLSRIEVRVDVSETDISKVKLGDTAIIEADAYRNRKFKGVVSQIGVSSTTAATTTTTALTTDQVTNYTVHILILPQGYADLVTDIKGKFPFKPGMSASVDIQTNRQNNILSIPVNAVTTRDWPDSTTKKGNAAGQTAHDDIRQVIFVYDAGSKQVLMRDVKTGIQDNQYIQITEGLKEGEQVITAPYGAIARILKDKMKVTIVAKEKLFEAKAAE